jgi:hypothetical protein
MYLTKIQEVTMERLYAYFVQGLSALIGLQTCSPLGSYFTTLDKSGRDEAMVKLLAGTS